LEFPFVCWAAHWFAFEHLGDIEAGKSGLGF
jgi:hypothetical protein